MHSVYSWVVFLHVLGVFGFLFAHGAAAAVTFRLRPERNTDRIRMLLDLSGSVAVIGRVSLLALLAAGIALGFMGSWWGHGWIWTALGLFIVMSVSMTPLAAGSFNRLRRVTQSEGAPKGDAPQAGIAQAKAIEAAAAGLHPVALTVVGFGGLTLIPLADDVQAVLTRLALRHALPPRSTPTGIRRGGVQSGWEAPAATGAAERRQRCRSRAPRRLLG